KDVEAREAFLSAMHRWGARMVQRSLVGEMPAWMHRPMGQLLGQFRSFVMVAYGKQFLQGVNMADFQTWLTFSWSMSFAGISYYAQTALNNLGREDAERYRAERLSA